MWPKQKYSIFKITVRVWIRSRRYLFAYLVLCTLAERCATNKAPFPSMHCSISGARAVVCL